MPNQTSEELAGGAPSEGAAADGREAAAGDAARTPAAGEGGGASDAPDAGGASDAPAAAPERSRDELEQALAAAESKRDEHLEALLRTRAEMDNLRKRVERDLESAHKYALERFVQELLPVVDSMEMGVSAASEDGVDVARLREGSELTLKMLKAATAKFGVTEVDPQGERFDPERHQAMSMVDAAEAESGTVVSVVQKGYLLNDRLVRPALVMVAR